MSQLSATIGVLAALAQTLTVPTAAVPPAFPGAPSPARTAPFEKQVAPPPSRPEHKALRAAQVAAVQLLPRVVCGMVVVPVDPAVDARMVKPVPTDVTFNMRVVKPPVCLD